jgi:hypothetical protein
MMDQPALHPWIVIRVIVPCAGLMDLEAPNSPPMEKQRNVGAQVYGYTVCVVAVITFLIAISSVVGSVMDLGDPLHAGYTQSGAPSLASFDNYRMDVLKNQPSGAAAGNAAYTPDEAALHAMFEAAKADKVSKVKHDADQSIIIGGLIREELSTSPHRNPFALGDMPRLPDP